MRTLRFVALALLFTIAILASALMMSTPDDSKAVDLVYRQF